MAVEKLKKIQAPVTDDVYDRYMELYNEISANGGTHSTLIEVLLERYSNPIKLNEANADKVRELSDEIGKLQQYKQDCDSDINTLIKDKQELQERVDRLTTQIHAIEDENAKMFYLREDEHILHIDKLNMLVLEEVAEREGSRRKQDWTVSDIINYFIEKRFINGELNGDLRSLPDTVIKRIKESINS